MPRLPSRNPWANYLSWMLLVLLVFVAFVGAINVFMDPLGVFGSPRVAGLNRIKPHLDHHRELARYQSVLRICPPIGIFGNSRAEIGFDPEGPAIAAHGLSAFNSAISGIGVRTIYQQILWLQAANCLPKTALLGVDFFDFLGGSTPLSLPSLQTDPAPRRDNHFFAQTVFSITGLRDSVTTLLIQRSLFPATTTDHGFNPLFEYIPEVAQSGHYALFRQRAEENVRNWTRKPRSLRPPTGDVSDGESVFNASLSLLNEAGTKTYVIIYPYHAQIRMLIERLGMGALFADWKRHVFESAARQAEKGGGVEVWDFSGIGPETLEAIPAKGDRHTQLAYYWEAGHFKKELGDLMISRVLGAQGNFGVALNRLNLESWLIEDRNRVQKLLANPSPLLSEVDSVLATQSGPR